MRGKNHFLPFQGRHLALQGGEPRPDAPPVRGPRVKLALQGDEERKPPPQRSRNLPGAQPALGGTQHLLQPGRVQHQGGVWTGHGSECQGTGE